MRSIRLKSLKSKREGTTPPETPRQKKPKGGKRRNEVPSNTMPIGSQAKDSDWTTVVKAGIRKAERSNATVMEKTLQSHITTEPGTARPVDAFKIKKCGESTYAVIQGIIKGAPDLKVLQERVTLIKRTKTGELFWEMDKPCFVTQELQTLVSFILAGSATVQTLTHNETVHIKDLDETTTEEVVQAITSVVDPGIVTTENIRLRASYSGTQAASVLLPIGATRTLIKAHKLRIRWINRRLRLRGK